ncbi:hypothetical protein [Xenorhabdus sp. Sc-CR9]|uniref:hypothetical protein n=1 Tax=Xenorhabdus sp. Sc-CR9 TaxID=2584468 RepID=UPI001F3DA8BA|nr:hypothetical protein [Xenorhabdus sp. Sc-CR9]
MIESILQDAIKHSRTIFRGKSSNKMYRDITKLHQHKKERYTPESIRNREDRQDEFSEELSNIEPITDRYQYALSRFNSGEELVGNCGELTIAVFNYLANTRSHDILRWFNQNGKRDESNITRPVYILFLMFDDPYDHCIAVITQPEQMHHIPDINKVYNTLPDNSWVCDSWANIACASEEYITRWKIKMLRWDLVEKTTSIYQPEQTLDYPSPLRPRNLHAITRSKKRVNYMAVIQPNGIMQIIQ